MLTRGAWLLAMVSVIVGSLGTAGRVTAQDSPAWVTRSKSSGTNPLLTTKPWPTEAATGATTASDHLETLLAADTGTTIVDPTRNYIILVAGAGWNEMFVLRTGCFTVGSGKVDIAPSCDLKELRVMGQRNVSILAIKRATASFDLTWEVTQKKRDRLDVLGFLTYILPTLSGALAGATGYDYNTAEEPLTLLRLPVDIEVKAASAEFVKGERKEKPFGGTVANYANEFLTLGVGAAVRKTDEVSLDLAANSLTAKDVSKVKTYGLVDLHFERVDPFSPKRWSWPFLTAGVEINTKQFNYGVGVAWRIPFIKNTSIGVLGVHALPEQTDEAKGAESAATQGAVDVEKRKWKAAFIIHYIFPLPKSDNKK